MVCYFGFESWLFKNILHDLIIRLCTYSSQEGEQKKMKILLCIGSGMQHQFSWLAKISLYQLKRNVHLIWSLMQAMSNLYFCLLRLSCIVLICYKALSEHFVLIFLMKKIMYGLVKIKILFGYLEPGSSFQAAFTFIVILVQQGMRGKVKLIQFCHIAALHCSLDCIKNNTVLQCEFGSKVHHFFLFI